MAVPAFDPKELDVIAEIPGMFPGAPPTPVYNYPVTAREAVRALYRREPIWQITGMEQKMFNPSVNPDNVAKCLVLDGTGMRANEGGADIFGIEWEFVQQAGGPMVRPGTPLLADANEWREKLVFPDVDSWDWEGAKAANAEFLKTDDFVYTFMFTGWFERLITFMDFEPAILALVDDEQQDAVKELFDKISDTYIKIIDKYLEFFPQIDGFSIHDDWGSQRDTFFSPSVVAEMIVPYMRKVTDYLHSKGKACDLHSCGQLSKQIPNMIAAGWDSWSGQVGINDTAALYEQYGDKLIFGIIPDDIDPTAPEEEHRAAARAFAERFCDPKRPSMINFYSNFGLPRAFREELYARSRVRYGG